MTLLLDLLTATGLAFVTVTGTLLLGGLTGRPAGCVATDRELALPVPAPGAGGTDLTEEVAAALSRAGAAAARAGVRLGSALEPGLVVRGGARAVRETLETMLASAIAAAPCGKVLVTLRRQGSTAVLAVLDDGAGDARTREAALREAAQAVALGGGRLEISAIASEGVTVALRLPLPLPLPARTPASEEGAGNAAPRPAAALKAAALKAAALKAEAATGATAEAAPVGVV